MYVVKQVASMINARIALVTRLFPVGPVAGGG